MKTIYTQRLIISVCFLFIIAELNAQKSFSSDLLIGEWFYQGPEKPKVNDTIKLIKDLSVETLSEY